MTVSQLSSASSAPLPSLRTALAAALLSLGLLGACPSKPAGHPSDAHGPAQHTRRDLDLSPEQARHLATLAAAADAEPSNFEARKRSGLAHMNFTLAGVLRLQTRAERDLEAAFALDTHDSELNRSLGRFYNMRAVDGDTSKADAQVEVYAALLGDTPPAAMSNHDFVAYSFSMLGAILAAKNRGNNLEALVKVKRLERTLAERVRAEPDTIELRALAGNFSFFFAGNIPIERERRVREAVAYFEVLRARWDELRPGARHPEHCPNTRENFMFELAEGLLVLEREAEARAIYTELETITEPRTRAKELIAHVASERLANASRYRGDMRLMPPWPSDVSNCVVCHAWTSEVGLDSLHTLEPLRLEDIPSKAMPKPITELEPETSPSPARIESRERLPPAIATMIEQRCAPCHFAGGEALSVLDLSSPGTLEAQSTLILERIQADEMPPEQALPEHERERLRMWISSLEGAQ